MEARRADATRVLLAPHDPQWAETALLEAARIASRVGPSLLRVEHIGSTAIPEIAAKPTIDLMPVVRSASDLDDCRAPMESLGYTWRGEFGIPGRRYSVLEEDGRRLFHVHIFAEGDVNVARHVIFRDYLRTRHDEALAYEAIKREAAAAHPWDSLAYNDHKSAWILACQERAKAWAAEREVQ